MIGNNFPRMLVLGGLVVASVSANAISVGVPVFSGPITNPFNGAVTEAWRLVGNSACSAFQISRDWVASSNHCKLENGSEFSNLLAVPGGASSLVADCFSSSDSDVSVCRLVSPEKFVQPPTYPPLTLLPKYTAANATKWGSLQAFGRGDKGPLVNFTDFSGMPYGFNAALDPAFLTVPKTVMNDSSGALFWYPPSERGSPAIVGVISGQSRFNYSGAGPFSAATLEAIANHTAAVCRVRGCLPPTIIATSAHYVESAVDPAADLPSKPVVSGIFPGLALSWLPSPPVLGGGDIKYAITVGVDGVKHKSSVSGVVTTGLMLDDLPVDKVIHVCVVPSNENGGRANLVSPFSDDTPNCSLPIDTRPPNSVTNLSLPVSASTSSSFRRVGVNWLPVSAFGNPVSTRFEGGISVRLPGASTGRDTAFSTTSASVPAVNVVRGSTVCAKVVAVSQVGRRLPVVSKCVTAN